MPLQIVDATEDDISEMMRMDREAYTGSMAEKLFFPNGWSDEVLELQGEGILKPAREDPTVRNIKVIDTDHNDEVIAFARWNFYFGDNARYIKTNVHSKGGIIGADPAALAMWNTTVRKKRIETIGLTPHCYLSNLVTDPKHQRRGAGAMLTRWGCRVAEENGVVAYVQSSPAGYQTYRRCGFKEVYATEVDLGQLAQQGICRNWLMVRHPQERAQDETLS